MTPSRGPARVPTLTEEVPLANEDEPVAAAAEPAEVDTSQLANDVLLDVQRQVDLMLEYRLREAIGPALARASDTLIRELRNELAATLRDLVDRAVAQEIARHRGR